MLHLGTAALAAPSPGAPFRRFQRFSASTLPVPGMLGFC